MWGGGAGAIFMVEQIRTRPQLYTLDTDGNSSEPYRAETWTAVSQQPKKFRMMVTSVHGF